EAAQPVQQPLQQGRFVVVDRLGELVLGPLPRIVGRRGQRDVPGQGAEHAHASWAARASSTSRPSRRMRTSMYSNAVTAAMNGVVTAIAITPATRLSR